METQKRILLLIGSAKKNQSNSESLGDYLINKLNKHGLETNKLFVHKSILSKEKQDIFLSEIDKSDIIILSFPLYIDSLPYMMIKALELITHHRLEKENKKIQKIMCIINCGFPEAQHCETAIAICRKFAKETGFFWLGGLALGGGEALNGEPLEKLGGMAYNVTKSIELTADAIVDEKPIPREAVNLMTKSFVPKWAYILLGGYGWKKRAKKFKAHKNLKNRPYKKK